MKKQLKLSTTSKLLLLNALIFVGLVCFSSLPDYFAVQHTKVSAHSSYKPYKNTVVKSVYPNLQSSLIGLEQAEINTQIDSERFKITAPGEISFNFSGYGNPQRPFPGYVGRFQLGPVRISGSGVISAKDGKLLKGGYITHRDDLLAGRYRRHRTNWRVVRGLDVNSKGGVTILKLLVKVVNSNYTRTCPVGTQGVLTLTDDNRRMNNRQTRDGIVTQMPNPYRKAADGGAACRTHVHGMNNVNYTWTDPQFGGSGGGNWAKVNIIVNATNSKSCNISGSWRQNSRGVSSSIWTFTHLGGNRYQATERGSGNAKGTAVLNGNQLRLDAQTGNLSGYYIWTLKSNCNSGSGKLVFTRGRRSTHSSTISRISSSSGGNSPVGRYRRYTNSGINGSFDLNYFFKNTSVKNCSIECNKHRWCRSFEYIPSRRYCYLYRKNARKSKRGVNVYIKQ